MTSTAATCSVGLVGGGPVGGPEGGGPVGGPVGGFAGLLDFLVGGFGFSVSLVSATVGGGPVGGPEGGGPVGGPVGGGPAGGPDGGGPVGGPVGRLGGCSTGVSASIKTGSVTSV